MKISTIQQHERKYNHTILEVNEEEDGDALSKPRGGASSSDDSTGDDDLFDKRPVVAPIKK
jgi:hypothetical protein